MGVRVRNEDRNSVFAKGRAAQLGSLMTIWLFSTAVFLGETFNTNVTSVSAKPYHIWYDLTLKFNSLIPR